MNQHYIYLLVDIGCIFLPFIFSFHPKIKFYKQWKWVLPAMAVIAVIFLIWDQIFTENGFWGFNPDYLVGVYIFDLPIEEILFFFAIPYACVFTYYCVKTFWKKHPLVHSSKGLLLFLMVYSIVMLVLFGNKWYPLVTFSLLLLSLLVFFWKNPNLNFSTIFFSYAIILPFFFISNGILTGTWLESPIVWYSSEQISGPRIGTIPIEDGFYGFLLIFWNEWLAHWLKEKQFSRYWL